MSDYWYLLIPAVIVALCVWSYFDDKNGSGR